MNNKTYSNSINQFFDANEGFKKGNLSKLSYKPYKNYKEKEVVWRDTGDYVYCQRNGGRAWEIFKWRI